MAGRTRKFNPVLSEQDKATLEKIVSSTGRTYIIFNKTSLTH